METMFNEGLMRLAPQLMLLGVGGVFGLWLFRLLKLPGWIGAVLVGILLSMPVAGRWMPIQYEKIFKGGYEERKAIDALEARYQVDLKKIDADLQKVLEQFEAMDITDVAGDSAVFKANEEKAKLTAAYQSRQRVLNQEYRYSTQSLRRYRNEGIMAMVLLALVVIGWQCRPWNFLRNRMESLTLGIGASVIIPIVGMCISWWVLPALMEILSGIQKSGVNLGLPRNYNAPGVWQRLGIGVALSVVAMVPVHRELGWFKEVPGKGSGDMPAPKYAGDLSHAMYASTWIYQMVFWTILCSIVAIATFRPNQIGALMSGQGKVETGYWVEMTLRAAGLCVVMMLVICVMAVLIYWRRRWSSVDTQRILMCVSIAVFMVTAFLGFRWHLDMEVFLIPAVLAAGAIYLLPDLNKRYSKIRQVEREKQVAESLTWVDLPMALALAWIGQSMSIFDWSRALPYVVIFTVSLVLVRLFISVVMSIFLLNRSVDAGISLSLVWLRSGATGLMAIWLVKNLMEVTVFDSLMLAWIIIALIRMPFTAWMNRRHRQGIEEHEGESVRNVKLVASE